ncbi:MAG: AraC family transcriptional regulator [Victivallales bacterium]|nr:AraC family transcriptional regulator [Victivallales bacterium]
MNNDKIIDCVSNAERPEIHRLLRELPDFQRRYGLWIINSGIAWRTPEGGFRTCRPRKFEFYSISHLIDGAGHCWIDGRGEYDVSPGQIVVITPGTLNRYGGTQEKPYTEDSIRFAGPIADMLHNSGILRDGVYEFGQVRKLLPIAELIQDPSNDAQINANIALQNLLIDLYFKQRKTTIFTQIEELIELVKSRPGHWWTVEEMAEYCNSSVDQFRRNFERHTGLLPKKYIEELKLRQAAELLVSSSVPVAEVAKRFGYRDPYHFSRRFKLFAGVSPDRYRRELPFAAH